MRRLAAVALAGAALAGCGGDEPAGQAAEEPRTRTVERTTRVEVVRPAAGEGFDARAVFDRVGPGVVTVVSVFDGRARSPFGGEDGSGLGSGFVLDEDGRIVTNAHVITTGEGRSIRKASEVYVRFADHNQVRARIVGFDPNADVALLQVRSTAGLTLRPVPLGRSATVEVGAPVAAIGSPFGEEQSLSVGVVSATGRAIESLTGFQTLGAIQTDAAINQGNSGGPLVDAEGRVLGINAQIRTRSGGGEGVGYAIPVDAVRRSLGALRRHGRVRYAYLGVTTAAVYPQLAERFGLGAGTGAWVQEVVDGGPADRAGIRGGEREARFQAREYRRGGDVIVAVDGRRVTDENDVGEALFTRSPGETVRLAVLRDGRRQTLRVRLAERPAEVDQPRP